MNNSLSIIIPTRDRKQYLERVLYYLNKNNCPFKIFIADSSSKINLLEAKSIKNNKLNIYYLRRPSEKNFKDFLIKLKKIIIKTNSKYIYWLCDDDFVNINLLKEGIEVMQNSKYQSFIGRVKNFSIKDPNNEWSDFIVSNFQYKKLNNTIKKDFESIKFINRFKNLELVQPYEAIVTRKIILETINFCIKNNIKNTHDYSLVYKTFILISGPSYATDKVILLRQSNVKDSTGYKIGSSHEINFRHFYISNLPNIGLRLKKIIILKFNLNKKEKVIIDLIFENYVRILSDYLIKEFLIYSDLKNKKIFYKIFHFVKYYKNKIFNMNFSLNKKLDKKNFNKITKYF